jgi:hypothetical protein
MGWSFRRSINLGPVRINISRSGIGYSVGASGFRAGRDSRGRRYRWLAIPKMGVYRRDYLRTTRVSWAIYIGIAILLYVVLRIIFAII